MDWFKGEERLMVDDESSEEVWVTGIGTALRSTGTFEGEEDMVHSYEKNIILQQLGHKDKTYA
jgi:hypothetical protein